MKAGVWGFEEWPAIGQLEMQFQPVNEVILHVDLLLQILYDDISVDVFETIGLTAASLV